MVCKGEDKNIHVLVRTIIRNQNYKYAKSRLHLICVLIKKKYKSQNCFMFVCVSGIVSIMSIKLVLGPGCKKQKVFMHRFPVYFLIILILFELLLDLNNQIIGTFFFSFFFLRILIYSLMLWCYIILCF